MPFLREVKKYRCSQRACKHGSDRHYEGRSSARKLRTKYGLSACSYPGCPCPKYVAKPYRETRRW